MNKALHTSSDLDLDLKMMNKIVQQGDKNTQLTLKEADSLTNLSMFENFKSAQSDL